MIDGTRIELVDIAAGFPTGATIGGKAEGLAKLAGTGLPVPPGRVVPIEATEGDIERLASILAGIWPDRRLAVRSSAVGEDAGDVSFAGQFESVLDVSSEAAAIAAAIRRVRSSAHAQHVATYGHGVDHPMAVLVMPMIEAEAAGIAFTRNPVTGADQVVVEAVAGVADRLAAGEAVGERWVIDRDVRCEGSPSVLTEPQATAVAQLARRVEAHRGGPVDIEWALADGEPVVLQARPITALVEPIPMSDPIPPGFWQWDSTHNRAPVSPLLADIFPEAMRRGSRRLVAEFGLPIDHLALRAINGYLYIQVVPIGGRHLPPPPPAVMRVMGRILPPLRRAERTARMAFAEGRHQRWHRRWLDDRRPQVQRILDDFLDRDLTALDDASLAQEVEEAAELIVDVFSWNMVTDVAYLVPLSDLHRFVETHLGEGIETTTRLVAGSARSDYRRSIADLAARLTPTSRQAITGPDPLSGLDTADPAFAAAFRDHRRTHGLRILGFDFTYPTQLEQPEAELRRIVADVADRDPSRDAMTLADQLAARLDGERAVQFRELVDDARSTYWIREEGEAVHAATIGRMRLVALEIGRRLQAAGEARRAEDACFLTLAELVGWLGGRHSVADRIKTRRGQQLWAATRTPPASLGDPVPMPPREAFRPNTARILDCFRLVEAHDQRPAEHPDGVAASPGIHTGPVRVVHGPEEFRAVRPGDVLVAPLTTSSWEVLFPLIGALVTEGGGQLSHPAIVAREYGLPAVVGCERATSRFTTGQIVTVDGSTGVITPVE